MQNPNIVVREALEPTLTHFSAWRSDLARFAARAERRSAGPERQAMLERCAAIEAELAAARTDLIVELGEAPAAIAGHSRVADVEKALDAIEASLAELRRKLTP